MVGPLFRIDQRAYKLHMLDEFYFVDPRVVLVTIEHLSPTGLSTELIDRLSARSPSMGGPAALLSEAFQLYWDRTTSLSARLRSWAPPRLRNIAIVDSATAIPPYVQLLNTSTWTLFDCDCSPETSSVELLAYLLTHGDRMSLTGEATLAALHNAAYWFERSDADIAAFQRGAGASTRPDAEAYVALAEAIPWLRKLAHETLRPPDNPQLYRPIKGTGLLVPRALEQHPAQLVVEWTRVAKGALRHYFNHYKTAEKGELATTLEWLREAPRSLVITGRNNRIVWDCEQPDRIGPVRNELRRAGAETLRSIRTDLTTIDHHSRDFRERTSHFDDMPLPDKDIGQDGFTYLYSGRQVLAYNLYEAHLDRLAVPALPFARSMLGARAYHEWGHLAVDAAWVRSNADSETLASLTAEVRDALDQIIADAPESARRLGHSDLVTLTAKYPRHLPVGWGSGHIPIEGDSAGAALLRMLLPRAADYQANLLAARLQTIDERETYVRQNVRTLRPDYGHQEIWRMFARYLYELQYLRFSDVPDKFGYLSRSTWFDADFLHSGVVTEDAVARADRAFRELFDTFRIDETKIRL